MKLCFCNRLNLGVRLRLRINEYIRWLKNICLVGHLSHLSITPESICASFCGAMRSSEGPYEGHGMPFRESSLAAGGRWLKGIHGCRKPKTNPNLTSYILKSHHHLPNTHEEASTRAAFTLTNPYSGDGLLSLPPDWNRRRGLVA